MEPAQQVCLVMGTTVFRGLRGARAKDPVVPITAFTVPAEQLSEEIVRARESVRR